MPGYVHIFRLGSEPHNGGQAPRYQLNYTVGGNSYVRVFDPGGLDEFLRSNVGVTAEASDSVLQQLQRDGRATIAEVEIRESEAPAMGLEQLPSDS
ncbi:MAG: hypothetical protein ACR2IF_00720 [Terriglobales bacterium]